MAPKQKTKAGNFTVRMAAKQNNTYFDIMVRLPNSTPDRDKRPDDQPGNINQHIARRYFRKKKHGRKYYDRRNN